MDKEGVNNLYSNVAKNFGFSRSSTMPDNRIREIETESLKTFIENLSKVHLRFKDILEVGCGNGYVTAQMSLLFPELDFMGTDVNEEMIKVAQLRSGRNLSFKVSDAQNLNLEIKPIKTFDLVYSIRCIINLKTFEEQISSLRSMAECVNNQGYLILMEGFQDGHDKYNEIRNSLGLKIYGVAPQNLYLKLDLVDEVLKLSGFTKISKIALEEDFGVKVHHLSSHYIATRIINSLISEDPEEYFKNRNHPMCIYLSKIIRHIDGFSPLQFQVWRKIN